MRRIEDEDEVRAAFERFTASPLAPVAMEMQEEGEALQPCVARKDTGRRAVVPVDCTLASYAENFSGTTPEHFRGGCARHETKCAYDLV